MSKKQKKAFKPFSEKKQKQYEREARLQYGPELVNESVRRWESYSKAEQEAIQKEGGKNYQALAKALENGLPADDAEVQALIRRWHDHIHYFYTPTNEILRGLGTLYTSDPEFHAFFDQIHPALAEYLEGAITHYVDALEDAELSRLLAEDDRTAQA